MGITLKQFKLTKTQIVAWKSTSPPAKKVILKIELNDLKDPTTIKLFGYPATNAANGGEGQRGTEIPNDGTNPVIGELKTLRIGNNEINIHTISLNLFDYIILTPGIKTNTYTGPPATTYDLVFKLSYFNNPHQAIFSVDLPGESNPSPPAKPED